MAKDLCLFSGNHYRDKYLANIVLDPGFGLIEHLDPTTLIRNPNIFKAKATRDPDTPNIGEAMTGPHREEFLEAIEKEVDQLEKHGTWEVVKRSEIKCENGKYPHIVPSTWAFKIKHYPDG